MLVLVSLLTACGGGADESELFEACLAEGRRGINSAGMDRDSFCKCAAQEAKAILSPDAQRAMVLEMSGKRADARAITSKMAEPEQKAAVEGTLTVLDKCEGVGAGKGATPPQNTPRTSGGAPSGRYRAENAGESITLDFLGGQKVRVTLADQRAAQEKAEGTYEVRGDRITVRFPGGEPLTLTNRGNALEGVMDNEKVSFVRQ